MDYAAARPGFAPATKMPSPAPVATVLLVTAGIRPLLWVLGSLGIYVPFARYAVTALGLVSVVLTLVWLHGAFTAMRGRTHFSPGMAVGGWFIPLANLVLPALILRDAWRTAVGKGGGIAFLWMAAWWLTTVMTVLVSLDVHFAASDGGPVLVLLANEVIFDIPGVGIGLVGRAFDLLSVGSSVAAYGLLALIVHRVGVTAGASAGRSPAQMGM